jgi:predicted nucleic acid-binding protein
VRFVLDTSAAVTCFAREEGSDAAIGLLASGATFIVPDIFPLEVASALLRKERRGDITLGTTQRALVELDRIAFDLVPHAAMLGAATAMASRYRHGAYDCLFLMIARDRAVPVATFDGPMAGLARQLGIELWTPPA